MNLVFLTLIYGTLALPLIVPVSVCIAISLAIVGSGLRLIWISIAVPTYLVLVICISFLFSFIANEYTQTMWTVASVFLASGALCPIAVAFRNWIKRPADINPADVSSHL
jgi:hypothetical protein